MSVITKGRIFANREQLTAEKLNVLVDDASFNSSTAVDNSTTRVNASGAITVKPQGITSTELDTDAVTEDKIDNGAVTEDKIDTGAVTTAKIDDGAVTEAKIAASERWQNAYPVGSIYMNAEDSTDPSVLLGFGTWVAFGAGRVPVGIDSSDADFDTAEETGGEKTHTLDLDEMPSHRHGGIYPAGSAGSFTQGFDVDNATSGNTLSEEKFTTYTGGDETDGTQGTTQAHNNLQPYIVVYMWKRTA